MIEKRKHIAQSAEEQQSEGPRTIAARPTFVLTLQPTPRHDDADGMRRLRAALKALLRGYGLRCTAIGYPHLSEPQGQPGEAGQTQEAQKTMGPS